VAFSSVPRITTPKGDLATPPFESVRKEFERINSLVKPGFQVRHLVGPGSAEALKRYLDVLGAGALAGPAEGPLDKRAAFDPALRQGRQVKELETHVQNLVRESEHVRNRFLLYKAEPKFTVERWSTELGHPTVRAEPFLEAAKWYREYFSKEVMGRFEEPLRPPNPRTRKVYDTEKWTGYEVVLDVWPEVFAWGVLLVRRTSTRVSGGRC